jgi:hypothetical protein
MGRFFYFAYPYLGSAAPRSRYSAINPIAVCPTKTNYQMKKNTFFWSTVAVVAAVVMLSLALTVVLSLEGEKEEKYQFDGDDLHKPSKDSDKGEILTRFEEANSRVALAYGTEAASAGTTYAATSA